MPYSAMILLILAILSGLLGFAPESGGMASGARLFAFAFTGLLVARLALAYIRSRTSR